jgi:RNA polymerase sigma-70 factor (ECF subfamily)
MIPGAPSASDSMGERSWQAWADEDLVQFYQERSEAAEGRAAVTELLGRYRSLVYQWCRGYTRERESALDLAQEVLVNAYRGLDGFDGKALFSSWLFAVARNRCLSHVRSRKPEQDDQEILEMLPAKGPAPDAALDRDQRQQALRQMMREHLSEREEEAIWLRIIERMTVDQITAVLGLENATGARSLLQNARRKLRRGLSGKADPFREDE